MGQDSMTNQFDIGDIVTLNKSIKQDVYNVYINEPHYLITDIDFVLQKYITMPIGSNNTFHFTIKTMNEYFYKVA